MAKVLITGSSSGIGLETVKALLSAGHEVAATMRKAQERKSIFPKSDKLHVIELDVTDEEQRKAARTKVEQIFSGRLDVLINNAGFGMYGSVEDCSEKQLRQQFEVNFFAAAMMTQEFLPLLRKTSGKIINISSIMGSFSMPLSSMYSASKFALEGLSEGLFYELRPFGVQVCCVQPGGHRSNFIDNIIWSEKAFDPSSQYTLQVQNLQNFMKKRTSGKRVPVSNVSKVIVDLIAKRKMPLRKVVGSDAKILVYLKKILTTGLYYKITSIVYGKLLQKEVSTHELNRIRG